MYPKELEAVNALPVVKAMKGKAPLTTGVLQVPVELPSALYARVVDWEHDDCVEASVCVLRSLGVLVLDVLPRLPAYQAKRGNADAMISACDVWLAEHRDRECGHVMVSVPLPLELVNEEWPHWLSVAIGRYTGRCLCASADALSARLGVPSATAGLLEAWDAEVYGGGTSCD